MEYPLGGYYASEEAWKKVFKQFCADLQRKREEYKLDLNKQ
jgi:hypothetical protein